MKQEMTIFPGVKALIFDCDGTLVDNMHTHFLAWHKAFKEWDCQCTDQFLSDMAGVPTHETIVAYNRQFDADLPVEEFAAFKDKVALEFVTDFEPFSDTVQLVKDYHGRMPLAVVSGGQAKHVHGSLDYIGIKELFKTIITADTDVAPKPSPDIFLLAAKELGIPPEQCQVFEDADPGIQGALAAGMKITDVREYR